MSNDKWWFACVLLVTALVSFGAAFEPVIAIVLIVLVVAAAFVKLARARVAKRLVMEMEKPRLILELALFPLLVSVRQSPWITLALIGALLLLAICRMKDPGHERINPLPFAFLAISAVIVFRGDRGATAILVVLVILLLAAAASKVRRLDALHSLGIGLALYLIGNVLGHFAHIKSPLEASRLGGYQTSAGLFAERLVFPFARSINEPAVLAAAYIGLIAATWMIGRKVGKFHIAGVLAGAFIMAGSNSRLPLVVAVLLALATLMSPMLAVKASVPMVIAAGALPFYLTLAEPAIRFGAGVVSGSQLLARGQSIDDIVGLGTRGRIWTGSVRFWGAFPDQAEQLFGYGPNGHATSGANSTYLHGLGGFLANKDNLTMHNSFLQMLFDGGLVGLSLLAVAIIVTLRRFAADVSMLPQLMLLTVVSVGAASEIILAPGFTQTPFFVVLAVAAFSTARRCASADPSLTAAPFQSLNQPRRRMSPTPLLGARAQTQFGSGS